MGVIRMYEFEATCDLCGVVVLFKSGTVHSKRQALPVGWTKNDYNTFSKGKKYERYCQKCSEKFNV